MMKFKSHSTAYGKLKQGDVFSFALIRPACIKLEYGYRLFDGEVLKDDEQENCPVHLFEIENLIESDQPETCRFCNKIRPELHEIEDEENSYIARCGNPDCYAIYRIVPDKTICISIEGGLVTDVENLPDGWDYEIRDYDVEGADEEDLKTDKEGREYY